MNFYFLTNSLSGIYGFLLFIFYTYLSLLIFFNDPNICNFDNFEDEDNDSKKEKQNMINDNGDKIIIPYEKKYNDKFNKMLLLKEQENKDDEKLTKCILFENTTLGNVIMFYKYYEDTKDASSFHFYADHNIPYRYLESIAQKYCIVYHCTHIFINMSDELKKMEEIKENKNNQQEKNIKQTKQVFANFKSYNSAKYENNKTNLNKLSSTLNTISSTPMNKNKNNNNINNYNDNEVRIIQNISNNNNKKIQNNNDNENLKFYKEKNNRYTYLGKLCNFSFIQKNSINYKINENISYKNFKKKLNNENHC